MHAHQMYLFSKEILRHLNEQIFGNIILRIRIIAFELNVVGAKGFEVAFEIHNYGVSANGLYEATLIWSDQRI